MQFIKRLNYLIPIVSAILIWTVSSFAQEAAPPSSNTDQATESQESASSFDAADFSLEDLLNITIEAASLFEEDELVIGAMASSISSDQWKKLGARRVSDVLANELSLVVYPHLVGNNVTGIRGYATDSLNKGTAYLIDGNPINGFNACDITFVSNFGLGTLDRIEVIKGPGSAIYGSDAFHGAVAMNTFESDTDHYSAEIAGAYPLYGDANIKISQGFADNLLRVNLAADAGGQAPLKQNYDYETDTAPTVIKTAEREPEFKTYTGVFKIDINPADKIEVKLSSYINNYTCKEFPGINTSSFGKLEEYDFSEADTLFYMGNGSVVYTLGNKISFEAKGYYLWADYEARMEFASTGDYVSVFNKASRTGANFIIKQPGNDFNLQWLIAYGYCYMESISSYTDVHLSGSVLSDDEPVAGKGRTINSIYAQAKWGIIKKSLYLLLGGRLDNYSDYGNQITPRGGLIFQPTDKSSIKALYGRAFRAASASELYGVNNDLRPNEDLKPETIDIYELILMYKEKDWKTTANIFYSKWTNGITWGKAAVAGLAPNETTNRGKSDSYGGEWSIFYSVNPHAVSLGFSYIKSKAYDVEKGTAGAGSDLQDEDYVAFPEYIANAGIHLTFYDVNFFLNNRIYLNMKESHFNKREDPEDLPTYWRMDLNISKTINENADVTLDVHNLLNRKNYLPSLYGSKNGFEEPGISVLLRAGYKL